MADATWIGLGAIGPRMGVRLVAAHHRVAVWNRTCERVTDLARRADARVTATAVEAAEAGIVALVVTDAAAVAEVAPGPDGVLNGVHRAAGG